MNYKVVSPEFHFIDKQQLIIGQSKCIDGQSVDEPMAKLIKEYISNFNSYDNNKDEIIATMVQTFQKCQIMFLSQEEISKLIIDTLELFNESEYTINIQNLYLAMSYHGEEMVEIMSGFPVFELLVESFFSRPSDISIYLKCFDFVASLNQKNHDLIFCLILKRGGFHSILRYSNQTGINENKVFSISMLIYSFSLYKINNNFGLDDILECASIILESKYINSKHIIAKSIKNILNLIDLVPQVFFDYCIIELLIKNSGDNVEILISTCISLGLLKSKKNDFNFNIDPLINLINSPNPEVFIASSWCIAIFCFHEPKKYQNSLFANAYLNKLQFLFSSSSMENKIDLSFQIAIFSHIISRTELVNQCKNGLLSTFAEILNTKSVFLLDNILQLLTSLIREDEDETFDFNDVSQALLDIQNSEDFLELSETNIPLKVQDLIELINNSVRL